jgi:hypothetical protein
MVSLLLSGFDERFKVREFRGPEDAVMSQPAVDSTERPGIQAVKAIASAALFSNEVRAPQQPEMLGNGRPRNRKSLSDLPRGKCFAAEQIQHSAPRRVGHGVEDGN